MTHFCELDVWNNSKRDKTTRRDAKNLNTSNLPSLIDNTFTILLLAIFIVTIVLNLRKLNIEHPLLSKLIFEILSLMFCYRLERKPTLCLQVNASWSAV